MIDLSVSILQVSPHTPKVRAMLNPHWQEPLREAAREGKRDKLSGLLHTGWKDLPDPMSQFLHETYAAQIRKALRSEMPELATLLREAGARVIVWPGCFMFGLPDNDHTGYLVEEMTAHTFLLPWASDLEKSKAH